MTSNPTRVLFIPWLNTRKPWEGVNVDFFEVEGKEYFVFINSESKWINVEPMPNTTSAKNIEVLRSWFAVYGLQEVLDKVCLLKPDINSKVKEKQDSVKMSHNTQGMKLSAGQMVMESEGVGVLATALEIVARPLNCRSCCSVVGQPPWGLAATRKIGPGPPSLGSVAAHCQNDPLASPTMEPDIGALGPLTSSERAKLRTAQLHLARTKWRVHGMTSLRSPNVIAYLRRVHLRAWQLSGESARLHWKPLCQNQLRHPQDGARITAVIPPKLEGHWVSTGCEVRPGPEFITRSYTFYLNRTFKAYQFYYTDHQCMRPAYTLVIKGRIRLRQASWITRGATKANYRLHQVAVAFHSGQEMAVILDRMNCSCTRLGHFRRAWLLGETYEILNARTGCDCTAGIGFAMHELSLVRMERQVHQRERVVKELFLGDIHTDWDQRTNHRPTGYQRPLQAALHHVHPCVACGIIYRADEQHPPMLPTQQEVAARLGGQWASRGCEGRPAVLFLTRYFTFDDSSHIWEGRYTHYSDPACRQPTFLVHAWGDYSKGTPSRRARGGTDFAFTATRALVTPLDETTTLLLNASAGGSCGVAGSWLEGLEQDITHTNGCLALGIHLPHTEYELVRIEWDSASRRLLFLGERPTDGTSPSTPGKRATSYQTPLLQCSGEAARITMRVRQQHHRESRSHGTMAWENSLMVGLGLLLAFAELFLN
ncbi:protein APCDD1-like [Heterodontus francisci]|uniref:protein APCDD1-like n=1 Tax=Heterodontus francisci TaxID=7792 RepID=UPI00355C9426